jgi:hypothetical protein
MLTTVSTEEVVQVIMHPNDYERNDIEKLAKQYKGQLREDNLMRLISDSRSPERIMANLECLSMILIPSLGLVRVGLN